MGIRTGRRLVPVTPQSAPPGTTETHGFDKFRPNQRPEPARNLGILWVSGWVQRPAGDHQLAVGHRLDHGDGIAPGGLPAGDIGRVGELHAGSG